MATSHNPAFSENLFAGYDQVYGVPHARSTTMTVQGTVGKTSVLLAVLSGTALWAWSSAAQQQLRPEVMVGALVASAVLALVTIFKPTVAPWTAPLYAAFEGVLLGSVSYLIEHSGLRGAYPGIAVQAVSLTCGTLLCMLFVYGSGLIRVTDRLRAGIVSATGAVCLVYIGSMVLGLFGMRVPFLREFNAVGIGIGLVIVGIAAFNLLLDFDFIDKGTRAGLPKFMEWYGAFGLILTLVWLYLEILQLLRQFYGRDSR